MDNLLLCDDCGWTGKWEECVKEYKGALEECDAEAVPQCPKCNSENLIELIGRSSRLIPVPV